MNSPENTSQISHVSTEELSTATALSRMQSEPKSSAESLTSSSSSCSSISIEYTSGHKELGIFITTRWIEGAAAKWLSREELYNAISDMLPENKKLHKSKFSSFLAKHFALVKRKTDGSAVAFKRTDGRTIMVYIISDDITR